MIETMTGAANQCTPKMSQSTTAVHKETAPLEQAISTGRSS